MFPQDNNGLAIVLPQVGASGQATVSGSMIFGINTQSNNSLGAAKAQALDDLGNFTTTFNGVAYSSSYIDSGSTGLYFLTSTQTGLPRVYRPAFRLVLSTFAGEPDGNHQRPESRRGVDSSFGKCGVFDCECQRVILHT